MILDNMQRAIDLIQSSIKEHHSIMVLGPYGCGKLECTKEAIKNLGLEPYTVNLALMEPRFMNFQYEAFLKAISDNGVLIMDDIQEINKRYQMSDWHVEIIAQAQFSKQPVVLVGRECPNLPVAMRCKVLKFTEEFPYELKEIN